MTLLQCPQCQSMRIQTKNTAKKAGGTIGALAGAASGAAGALRGASLGLAVGALAGPCSVRSRGRPWALSSVQRSAVKLARPLAKWLTAISWKTAAAVIADTPSARNAHKG